MMVLDTNVLVRYAIKDDKKQAEVATQFLQNNQCLLISTVLLETVWVLSSKKGYGLARQTVIERILHIAGLPNIIVSDSKQLVVALKWYESGMDFADALHLALSENQIGFASLDKRLWLKAKELGLVNRVTLLSTEAT